MNLQELNHLENGAVKSDDWRLRHTIWFSHIDGAGIVFYPRYFEMLADSFSSEFAITEPVKLRTIFRHPARLGEQLVLQPVGNAGRFEVEGRSEGTLCFESSVTRQAKTDPSVWVNDPHAFVRQIEIHEWMTGADSRLHVSRSYELTAVLMEDWFATALGYPFATLHLTDGALVPTVNLETDLNELPCSGDRVETQLSVLHVGSSSLKIGMAVLREGQLMFQTQQVVVFVRHHDEGIASVAIPQELSDRLNAVKFVPAKAR